MKKIFFVLASLSATLSFGQLSMGNYIVKIQTAQPYTALSAGTNISSGIIWDEENFKIPMGFTLGLDGKTTSDFSIVAGNIFAPMSDTIGVVNGFFSFGASDLIDRGDLTGGAKSPLRHLTTGVSPNRIFKFEAFNAGFFDEEDIYGTLNDSVNFQIWVYETSNIVEIRFGSSKITHASDYFYSGGSPLIGFAKDLDLDMFTITKGYTLKGSTTAPTIDSFTDFMTSPPVMTSYPTNGTVYRFIPKAVAASIGETTIAHYFNVYPTIATNNINIDYNQSQKSTIQIFASNGQLTKSGEIERGTNTIDISALATGNYVLKISNDEGNVSYKFVKQ
jgi:hypothetical protein